MKVNKVNGEAKQWTPYHANIAEVHKVGEPGRPVWMTNQPPSVL